MSKEEYFNELLKWVSPDSILVIDQSGKLRRVYVPFWGAKEELILFTTA
jgi:hypothetical protein